MDNTEERKAVWYGLMGEAVTRAMLPDPKLGELMLTAAEDGDPDAPLYEKIAGVARHAFRAGAAAALYLSEQEPDKLQQAFHELLDHPQAGEG